MNADKTIEAGGKTYAVRFTQNALFKLETESGKTLQDFIHASNILSSQWLLWAGLEGARRKYKSRSIPYTLDEAGDIIDDYASDNPGGHMLLLATLLQGITAAFPQRDPNADSKAESESDPKNAQTEDATGTAPSLPESSSV